MRALPALGPHGLATVVVSASATGALRVAVAGASGSGAAVASAHAPRALGIAIAGAPRRGAEVASTCTAAALRVAVASSPCSGTAVASAASARALRVAVTGTPSRRAAVAPTSTAPALGVRVASAPSGGAVVAPAHAAATLGVGVTGSFPNACVCNGTALILADLSVIALGVIGALTGGLASGGLLSLDAGGSLGLDAGLLRPASLFSAKRLAILLDPDPARLYRQPLGPKIASFQKRQDLSSGDKGSNDTAGLNHLMTDSWSGRKPPQHFEDRQRWRSAERMEQIPRALLRKLLHRAHPASLALAPIVNQRLPVLHLVGQSDRVLGQLAPRMQLAAKRGHPSKDGLTLLCAHRVLALHLLRSSLFVRSLLFGLLLPSLILCLLFHDQRNQVAA